MFTTSLATYEVLHGRSSMFRSRHVWIDYICINQNDLAEKAVQVEQMTEIYDQAERVVVWLGGCASDRRTLLAIGTIHMLSLRLSGGVSALEVYEGLALHQDTDAWLSFIQLWSHDWFTRLWIVQEAAVAKKVYICFGGMAFQWDCFRRIADVFKDPDASVLLNRNAISAKAQRAMSTLGFIEQLRPVLSHNRTVDTMRDLRNLANSLPEDSSVRRAVDVWTKSFSKRMFHPFIREDLLSNNDTIASIPLSFAHLLTAFATLDVTDDRDRVYALRGMVNVDVTPGTRPDYSKSIKSLYTDVAQDVWSSKCPFGVVGYAGIGLSRKLDLPSFVPDWTSVPMQYAPLTSACFRVDELGIGYNASRSTQHSVGHTTTKFGPCLQVQGLIFDTIQLRSDTAPQLFQPKRDGSWEGPSAESKAQMEWFHEAKRLAHHAHRYRGDDARMEAFWRTLIVDRKATQHPAPHEMSEEFENWQAFIERLSKVVPPPEDEDDRQLTSEERSMVKESLASTWSTHMAGGCAGRCFCITKQGRMGMSLPRTQVGDKICIVYGAATPWVIRYNESNSTRFGTQGLGASLSHEEAGKEYQLVGECYLHGVMNGEAMFEGRQPVIIHLR